MITIISWGELMGWYTCAHPIFNQAKEGAGLVWAGNEGRLILLKTGLKRQRHRKECYSWCTRHFR
jgi:hypothetical protein